MPDTQWIAGNVEANQRATSAFMELPVYMEEKIRLSLTCGFRLSLGVFTSSALSNEGINGCILNSQDTVIKLVGPAGNGKGGHKREETLWVFIEF